MSIRGLLSFITVLLALTSAGARALSAPSPPSAPLEIEVQPGALEICGDLGGKATVLAHNRTTEPITHVALTWRTSGTATLTSDPPSGTKVDVPPQGEAIFWLDVAPAGRGFIPGPVHLRADYEAAGASRIAFATFDVRGRTPEAVAQLARVEVKSSLGALSDKGAGVIHVVVTSLSSEPITLGAVAARAPSFIDVKPRPDVRPPAPAPTGSSPANPSPPGQVPASALAPGQARTFTFDVAGGEDVRSGKHMVIFEIDLATTVRGCAQSGTLVASHEIEVGVYGESAILVALGVPSMLLLPGFLAIAAMILLWRMGLRPAGLPADREFPLQAKSPELWFAAISLSLVFYAIPFMAGRDLRQGYGLSTIQRLWLLSAAVGAFSYGLGVTAQRIWSRRRRSGEERLRWSASDDPIQVLRKLAERGHDPMLPRAKVKISGKEYTMFVLAEGEKTWVCPGIVIRWADDPGESLAAFEAQSKAGGDCEALAEALTLGQGRQEIESVRFLAPGGVREVASFEVASSGTAEPLVGTE